MPISISSATPPTPPQGPDVTQEARKVRTELDSLIFEINSVDRTNYRDQENLTAVAGTVLQLNSIVERYRGI